MEDEEGPFASGGASKAYTRMFVPTNSRAASALMKFVALPCAASAGTK